MNKEYIIDSHVINELDDFISADMAAHEEDIREYKSRRITERRIAFLYKDKNGDIHPIIYPPIFLD